MMRKRNRAKRLFVLLTAALLLMGILCGCGKKDEPSASGQTEETGTSQEDVASFTSGNDYGGIGMAPENVILADERTPQAELDTSSPLSGLHHAENQVKDYGTITVELDADTAPITVTNFVKLANSGFYDGLTFHRIISGFMIQGGDPEGNGTGGSDEKIKGEFSANGVQNDISHKRGVISMARAQAMDSASSQFFIMHEDALYLDGNYAGFGHVTSGMEVVDQICENAHPTDGNGTIPSAEQPVIERITILD